MQRLLRLSAAVLTLTLLAGCGQTFTNPPKPIEPTKLPVKQQQNILDLSGQELKAVPQSVFEQRNLEELLLSSNQLTGALPGEIRQLQNLRVLKADHNQMTGIPAEIGQLAQLQVLDFSYNQITGLPYELGNLQNLQILNLSGNSYSKTDLEIIKKKLPIGVTIIGE